jgi:hypothetical protein
VFAGPRVLLLPIAGLALARLFVLPHFPETHALIDDPYGHLTQGFAFFFGVGLGGSKPAWQSILRWWKAALAAGLGAYGLVVLLNLTIAGESGTLELTVTRVLRSVQAWGAVIGLLGWARLKLHRDGPARKYLTDAIFPYYIAHQTIIVLAGFWLAPLGLGAAIEFLIILVATVAGCVLTYELGRRIAWLRPFIGLKPHQRRTSAEVRRATEPSTGTEPSGAMLD